MEQYLQYILTLSIGGFTIGAIVIFLGKVIINKSSEIIFENHKNKLDILKIEFQLKFSKLHEERAEIIKRIFQSLFELEIKLQELTSIFQGPEWVTDTTKDEAARTQLNLTREILEINRIFFSEELCTKIEDTLNQCSDVIFQMRKAKLNKMRQQEYAKMGEILPHKDEDSPLTIWQREEAKVKHDIKLLRMSLADNFREIMGVAGNS